ncbi:aminopeptidase [Sandaracinus amylolyticus]|uniref:Aminopeptidase n=1 Tax=Sandaracinus amylolyticus TaxID=927083 RepID=A0A0F6YNJ8_9BACT|nr:aminopeptidase [Sandaracinus amylolyticus]AKF10520.1 aminopeptidase [Sandaracinus amylolyticus]
MSATALSRVTVSQLDLAAREVVGSALAVREREVVAIFADATSVRMGDALARAVEARGAEPRMIWLDDLGPRPLLELPVGIDVVLEGMTASAFVASAPAPEITMRRALLAKLTGQRVRHAHMPGVSHLAFVRGLRVDYDAVAGHGMRLLARLTSSTRITVSSASGTRLRIATSPATRWMPQLGQLEPGRWGNLPAGALYAVPDSIDGVYVANAAVGPHATSSTPVTLYIADGRVVRLAAEDDPVLEQMLRARIESAPNRDRVGLVAIGCNYGIVESTGEAIVDQNMPGLHLALGDAASDVTGVAWSAAGSLPCCAAGTSVVVDGEAIVRSGVLVDPS